MRTRTIAALTAALFLIAAAPAAADSIAYIKDGNVWLSTPDGGRQYQVTSAGGYSYVSQADDGTMIALAPGESGCTSSRATAPCWPTSRPTSATARPSRGP
jgi:hypothetical protein